MRWMTGMVVGGALLLAGCSSAPNYAPVENAWQQPAARQGFYRVKRGDTLYSIAWGFGLDYRGLAQVNHLPAPYSISVGQMLKMTTTPSQQSWSAKPTAMIAEVAAAPTTVASHRVRSHRKPQRRSASRHRRQPVRSWSNLRSPVRHWRWPAKGKVVQGFSSSPTGNKGVNIAGNYGESIKASAGGVVVYSGNGVRGYGNLIIIKHNASYLSAYAYNRQNLVGVGQRVQAGQKIAQMGRTNGGKVMLHFEIRRNGKPINPRRYLG